MVLVPFDMVNYLIGEIDVGLKRRKVFLGDYENLVRRQFSSTKISQNYFVQ